SAEALDCRSCRLADASDGSRARGAIRASTIEQRREQRVNEAGDVVGGRIEGKVSAVDETDLCCRHILLKRFRLGVIERRVVFAPDNKQAGLRIAHTNSSVHKSGS